MLAIDTPCPKITPPLTLPLQHFVARQPYCVEDSPLLQVLMEDTTTILPIRGRALQGVGLSSMRFHPTARGHEDDEDGQEG